MRTTLRPTSRRLAAVAALALAAAASATPALAAPGTSSNGGGTVTLSDTTPVPGDTLTVTGSGFDDITGVGSVGFPIAAVKPDAVDDPYGVWTPGGPSNYTPTNATTAGEAKIWFRTDGAGRFTGTVRIPTTTPKVGPGDGGTHWLQILSGAPFTSTDYPNPSAALSGPISIVASFRIADRVELGVTTDRFYAGHTVRTTPAPTQLTARGRGFTPNSALTVTRGGTAVQLATVPATTGTITTTATGALPDGLRLNLGANLPAGEAPLVFTAGDVSETQTLSVLPAAAGSIDTPELRPGGLLSYRFSGFVGIAGAGQKVAIGLNGDTVPIACVQADATGSGSGVVRLPTAAPTGTGGPTPPAVGADATVRFLSGTSCVGPAGPVNDYPGAMVPATLAVADDAPTAAGATDVPAGSSFPVSGAGFGAGEQVTVAVDGGTPVGTLTSGADGAFSGSVVLPAGTPAGAHVLRFASPTATAVAELTTTPAPAVDVPPVTPPSDAVPAVPSPLAPPAVVPPAITPAAPAPAKVVAPRLTASRVVGTKLRLTLAGTKGRRVAVTVRSRKKVRVSARAKAKIVTFARTSTTRTGVVSFTLTSEGRKALRHLRRVSVSVVLKPSGGKAVTTTTTLRA